MTAPSERTQAFIIRIWYEAREIEGLPVAWRGVIRHVPSNEQRAFTDLWSIINFIQSYMEVGGVNLGGREWPLESLRRLMTQIQNTFPTLEGVGENQGHLLPPSPVSMQLSAYQGGAAMNETEWTLEVKVKDGPRFREAGKFNIEGYDRIDIAIPAKKSRLVQVQPGDLEDIELFFILRTDKPPTPTAARPAAGGATAAAARQPNRKLYYTIGGQTTQVELTDLHVVLGKGAIKLLCAPPNEICFTNEGDCEATVTILICRRTSEPCETPTSEETPEETPTAEETPTVENPPDETPTEPSKEEPECDPPKGEQASPR